jgi:hypothetical protein
MNDLTTLMHQASDQAPPDRLEVETLVRAGRSRVRRRRAVAGIAVAAVAGLVAGVPMLFHAPSRTAQPAGEPGQVLTLADATAAQRGIDYDVMSTFTAHSTDSTFDGDFVRGVLTDGTVVVQSYPRGPDGATRITLVGADRSRPVDAPRSLGNYLGATPTALVFGGDVTGVWTLDLASLEWRQTLEGQDFDTNVPAQPFSATQGRPTEIHLAAAATDRRATRPIYMATLGERDGTRLANGGDVEAFGTHDAWTGTYDAPNDSVVVRDEATGKETSFDPKTGRCDQKDLGLAADRVVVMVNCADAGKEQNETDVVDRIDVFDLTGKAITRITGEDLGPVRMTERFLTISSSQKGEAGTYTYDLETGRFLKVEDAMSGLAGNETGTGSTLVWEQRLDGDSGATYVVARMH